MAVTGAIFPKRYANAMTRHEQNKKYFPMQHQLVIKKTEDRRRVPAQDGLFALIIWYVTKTLY